MNSQRTALLELIILLTVILPISLCELCPWTSWFTLSRGCDWVNNRCVKAKVRTCATYSNYCNCDHEGGVAHIADPPVSCDSASNCPQFGEWTEWEAWRRYNETYCARKRECNVGGKLSYSDRRCLPAKTYSEFTKIKDGENCPEYSLINPIAGAIVGAAAILFIIVFIAKKCRQGSLPQVHVCLSLRKIHRRLSRRHQASAQSRHTSRSPSPSLSSAEVRGGRDDPPVYTNTVDSVSSNNLPSYKSLQTDPPPSYEVVMATPCDYNISCSSTADDCQE